MLGSYSNISNAARADKMSRDYTAMFLRVPLSNSSTSLADNQYRHILRDLN